MLQASVIRLLWCVLRNLVVSLYVCLLPQARAAGYSDADFSAVMTSVASGQEQQ
jgi:hypothetical protein